MPLARAGARAPLCRLGAFGLARPGVFYGGKKPRPAAAGDAVIWFPADWSQINLVWDPPWNPSLMSEEAQLELEMIY